MNRYLLYDSECPVCTKMAQKIETLAEGQLQTRSLRDPEVLDHLKRERPDGVWEPLLMEESGLFEL